MEDIGGLVSSDSRTPMERLRRVQLWAIAEDRGIQYPPDAPKTVMLALLVGAGVDPKMPYQGAGIKWEVINGQDEIGRAHQEIYPVQQEPDTPSQITDVVAATAKIAEKKPAFQFPLDKMLQWQLHHMCKDIGVDASKESSESNEEWKERMIKILEQSCG